MDVLEFLVEFLRDLRISYTEEDSLGHWSDEENFNLNVSDSGSESDSYVPVKKKKPVAVSTSIMFYTSD